VPDDTYAFHVVDSLELVIYPGEPHVMGRPSQSGHRLQRLLTWYERHLSLP